MSPSFLAEIRQYYDVVDGFALRLPCTLLEVRSSVKLSWDAGCKYRNLIPEAVSTRALFGTSARCHSPMPEDTTTQLSKDDGGRVLPSTLDWTG